MAVQIQEKLLLFLVDGNEVKTEVRVGSSGGGTIDKISELGGRKEGTASVAGN